MAHLVNSMDRKPPQRPFGTVWIVVDQRPVPVGGAEPREVICEHLRGVAELPRDIRRVLPSVTVELYPFVASHRLAFRPVAAPGRQQPLPLNEQHVANVTGVLQRRPTCGFWPGPDIAAGREHRRKVCGP